MSLLKMGAQGMQGRHQQDPYTHRAFTKPRGYAGDAVMLDYNYTGTPPPATTPIGAKVFSGSTGSPTGQSVVERRSFIAQKIDTLSQEIHQSRILSIACGHLREAQQSTALRQRAIGEYVALDQDRESLAVVENEQSEFGVRALDASILTLLRQEVQFKDFDLVYSLGLFDYLEGRIASKLLRLMYSQLAPHGTLLIANFTPETHGRGYMEAFMDWNLIYRDESELISLADQLLEQPPYEIYRDRLDNIVYLEISKES